MLNGEGCSGCCPKEAFLFAGSRARPTGSKTMANEMVRDMNGLRGALPVLYCAMNAGESQARRLQ